MAPLKPRGIGTSDRWFGYSSLTMNPDSVMLQMKDLVELREDIFTQRCVKDECRLSTEGGGESMGAIPFLGTLGP